MRCAVIRPAVLLVTAGLARAVLHASPAVDRAGRREPAQPPSPAVSAVSTEEEGLGRNGQEPKDCTPLQSVAGGSMYTAQVHVGTPEQVLNVTVDTGSSFLVVASCQCRDRGSCNREGQCFQEAESSTLLVAEDSTGPSMMVLSFGSGSILAKVTSETVRISKTSDRVDNGVFLMVDQKLDFDGPFGGILGLGPPHSKVDQLALRTSASNNSFDVYTHDESPSPKPVTMNLDHTEETSELKPMPTGMPTVPQFTIARNFLPWAGISSFSLCFTERQAEGPGGRAGELRFNVPVGPPALQSIGTMHWGLDFRGISVGDSPERLPFCSAEGMLPSQQTACGAIPDSGSTFILGPKEQLDTLFEALCDQWPRCNSNYTEVSVAAEALTASDGSQQASEERGAQARHTFGDQDIQPLSKAAVFQALLQDCDSWWGQQDMAELPPIHFHVADPSGLTKDLTLDASVYTVYLQDREMRQVFMPIPGKSMLPIGLKETGRRIWMCKPAFASVDYQTAHNGPSWILGVPVFQRYIVGFDVAAASPTISITEGPCSGCSDPGQVLVKSAAAVTGHPGSVARPRKILGRPWLPVLDTTQPL